LPVKQVDDERDHDRTPLFDHAPFEQISVSAWFRTGRKMVSSAANRCPTDRRSCSVMVGWQVEHGVLPNDANFGIWTVRMFRNEAFSRSSAKRRWSEN
jgi:hypothetical protein